MDDTFKQDISRLYSSGKSMMEISQVLHCSIHKVSYWMTKLGIQKRSRSEATYLKANPLGDPFNIRSTFTDYEKQLYGLGLGLYWGEGEKVTKGAVRVANSDPRVIIKFREFLMTICQLNPSKIHYSLICFNDSNPNEVVSYWSKILKISKENFGKIVTIPSQGKGTYKKKSTSGVCTITVSNIKLKEWIINQIESQMPT